MRLGASGLWTRLGGGGTGCSGSLADIASGTVADDRPEPATPAQEFARSGGLKGGKARADALSPTQRTEIAKRAAAKRWSKNHKWQQIS
jgi:hypothetical protein